MNVDENKTAIIISIAAIIINIAAWTLQYHVMQKKDSNSADEKETGAIYQYSYCPIRDTVQSNTDSLTVSWK